MPLYLIHGFRWTRAQIRIYIILNNLEDASADYIQGPATIEALRTALLKQHPALAKACPDLTFVEQHDPEDLRTGAQPFAFVADTVREAPAATSVSDGGGRYGGRRRRDGEGGNKGRRKGEREKSQGRIKGLSANGVYGQGLSMDVGAAMGRGGGISGETWDAMADLRDEIAKDESVGWFAVWNGDVERRDLGPADDEEEEEEEEEEKVKEDDANEDKDVEVEDDDNDNEDGEEQEDHQGQRKSHPPAKVSVPRASHGREARIGGGYVNGTVNGAGSGRQGNIASGSRVRDEGR